MGGYGDAMRSYATFRGRASRREFWGFTTVYFVLAILGHLISEALEGPMNALGAVTLVVILVHSVPYYAVSVRRMHDLDRTGWWVLLNLTLVGGIVLLFMANGTGTPGPNRFGQAPDATEAAGPGVEAIQQPPRDPIAEIERLAQLRVTGGLSETEYEVMKAQAMAGPRPRA